ncbi:HSPB1-associated protein 1 isoform X2 [Zophobas morio]|uniref:HSPB1-associated protein 1 isoform X2 n=1 Tax=Zophobas morio TaxID=2755281 RepID=UPI0030838427
MEPKDLRQLILSATEPFLIKNQLNWAPLTWTLDDWQQVLKDEKLIFRCGRKLFTKEPQWERKTVTKNATFKEFLSSMTTENQNWMYFDYKYLKEWFHGIKDLKDSINWSKFGFPELTFEDSTIWIGSAGAHTPCHVDTYGCNLIAQIYGRKQWVLCSPETDLKPTRVPYEESSIYSNLNFFSPNVEDFTEPGDVLFVPHKWWHYVENLDTGISINVWLPLPIDDKERLKESLVQLFIAQITKNLNKEEKDMILNPNSDESIESTSIHASINLIKMCTNIVKSTKEPEDNINEESGTYYKKFSFLHPIPILSDEDFLTFLKEQKNRFNNIENEAGSCDTKELANLVNAFTHADVISLIESKLLQ